MRHLIHRSVQLLLLVVLMQPVLTVLQAAPILPAPVINQQLNRDNPLPLPNYQPPPDPKLPAVSLALTAQPDTITVGMTTTLRLTITNLAPNSATDLTLHLPVPGDVRVDSTAKSAVIDLAPIPSPVTKKGQSIDSTATQLPPTSVIAEPIVLPPTDPTVTGVPTETLVLPPDTSRLQPPGDGFATRPPDVIAIDPHPVDRPVPVPSGPTPLGANRFSQPKPTTQDLTWTLPTLSGQYQATVALTLVLLTTPADGAVVFEPWVSAKELSTPIQAVGGVLAIAPDSGSVTTRFVPGAPADLRSSSGRVQVSIPAQAAKQALQLRYARVAEDADAMRRAKLPVPNGGVFGQAALDPFTLTATNDAGQQIHTFDTPITISVGYTEAQLRARGLVEGNLTLAWFDPQTLRWTPVPTTIDPKTHTASATVDHFSSWTLSDGSSPSALFVPSLQGFQTSTFTGAATYSLPIEVPAGAAGHRPQIQLTYSSAATDGPAGQRHKAQAGWVGKGWSVDAGGSVSRVRSPISPSWDYFTFSFGGKSYDIVRGTQFQGTPGVMDEANWTWYAVDEGDFLKVRAIPYLGTFVWVVWTKDGTRYEFAQPLVTSERQAGNNEVAYIYQWLLTRTVDSHGNHIDYLYTIETYTQGAVQHPTYYLSEILWAYDGAVGTDGWNHPLVSGNPRYRVVFQAADRASGTTAGVDAEWEYQTKSPEETNLNDRFKWTTPREKWRLDLIYLQSRPQGVATFDASTVAFAYAFEYYSALESIRGDIETSQPQLTLKRIARVGTSGSYLPWTTFTYGMTQGNWPYDPSWNRLTQATNGQGGRVSFTYASSFQSLNPNDWEYSNYQRVTHILREDTSGQVYSKKVLSYYDYLNVAVNTLSNSAKLWYAAYPPQGYGESRELLAHRELREFRGHASVTVREYDGDSTANSALLRATTYRFHQGDAGCTPTLVPNGNKQVVNESDPCYISMVASELWKGRPDRVEIYSSTGALLKRTEYTYQYNGWLPTYSDVDVSYRRIGLWRAFTPTRVVREGLAEGQANPGAGKTTAYCYQPNYLQGNAQLGNITHVLEWNQLVSIDYASQLDIGPNNLDRCDTPGTSVAPTRITRSAYTYREVDAPTLAYPIGALYYADRQTQSAIFGANSTQLRALTEYFYDGNLSYSTIGDAGRQTLVRAYGSISSSPFYSRDVSIGYDAWGNATTQTTYADWGTRTYPSYSNPGGAVSSPRTTSTYYDTIYHSFPISETNALGHVMRVDYDYRMGTMTKVGGPNVPDATTFSNFTCTSANVNLEISCAQYDEFGRMIKLIKPGDTTTLPTLAASYFDTVQPVRYEIQQRGTSGSGDTLFARVQFYDGLGRKIQEKHESAANNTQMVIVDTDYDGLGRVIATSQPRYDTTAWATYTPRSTPLYRPTTTTYDALDRTRVVSAPDSSDILYGYWISGIGPALSTYTAKIHPTSNLSVSFRDGLGRLLRVDEHQGDGSVQNPHAPWAETYYQSDPLDRLTQVWDAYNNTTIITYDALGQKLTMADPDMGNWTYTYEPSGNLKTQRDGRNQYTYFAYDALDRLTDQTYSVTDIPRRFRYDEASGLRGIGRRTSTCAGTISSCIVAQSWQYDGRGRVILASQTTAAATLSLASSYDSADRLITQTYGSGGEVVTTAYDPAGRPTSLCSSLSICYVSSASYSALDQPEQWNFGNTARQTWTYSSPMARLNGLKIGTSANPTAYFNASYTYDLAGNLLTLTNPGWGTQTYAYDHRDRLLSATGALTTESYSYDKIGNLTSKGGVSYSYGANGNGTGAGPHQARVVSGQIYTYDQNGNLANGGNRLYAWNTANQPTNIIYGNITETYQYDADGSRVTRNMNGTVTSYAFGVWERTGTNAKKLYLFNGRVVAQRDGTTNVVTWLHSDHLGGSLITTGSGGTLSESLWYRPWGGVGGGGITQTSINYTGQRLDSTGLLYYNARYYDPVLGRFISADSIVPGAGALTLSPHDATAAELWDKGGEGAENPQELNRYSYVNNNPLRYTDPSGHMRPDPCWRNRSCLHHKIYYGAKAALREAAFDLIEFGIGIGQTISDRTQSSNTNEPNFADGKTYEHYKKHGEESGYKDQNEYLQSAQKLIRDGKDHQQALQQGRAAASTDVLMVRRVSDGATLFWRKSTEEFLALNPGDKVIRTFFKPREGFEYWLKEINK